MRLAAALAALLAVGLGGWAGQGRAQLPSMAEQRERLRSARAAAAKAEARSAALERRAAAARNEAERIRAREAAMAARIQATEADVAAARARVAMVERLLRAQRIRLAERQGPILRLVTALQSFARRPPVLALVQPGSTADIAHVRAVLGTTLPVVEARTADVRGEVARVRKLRADAALALRSVGDARERLEAQRLQLVKMEAEHRLRSRDLDRSSMVESDRAIALGERARDLVDLMDRLDDQASVRDSLAALPGPLPRPDDPEAAESPEAASAHAAGRLPPYRLPVAGRLVSGLGEVSRSGVRSRGLTVETESGAQAVAPAPGRVAFAGNFRGYGRIVIIDHGQGWSSLVTGLDQLQAKVGETVAQGSPIGRAAAEDAPRVTVELRRRGQPVDLTALLD